MLLVLPPTNKTSVLQKKRVDLFVASKSVQVRRFNFIKLVLTQFAFGFKLGCSRQSDKV